MTDDILIVGGAGFIGTHLQKLLGMNGRDVTVLDSFLERVHGTKPLFNPKNTLKVDARNPEEIIGHLKNRHFSEIYFLASDTSTGSSLQEIDLHVNQNTSALAGILKYLNVTQKLPNRIVLTSSRAVYGEGHEINDLGKIDSIRSRTTGELLEQQWTANRNPNSTFLPNSFLNFPNPNNVYGVTKLFQENLLTVWSEANSVKSDIYRLQNVIGPGQSPTNPYSGIITNFCLNAALGNTLKVFEGGTIIRDFVHVEDVAKVLQIPLKVGFSHMDIGSYRPMRLIDIATKISQLCGSPAPEVVSDFRIGDVSTAYASPQSMVALSGHWRPREIDSEVLEEILDHVKATLNAAI
jgi:dTDP-L-rhamnose 4-epimerase